MNPDQQSIQGLLSRIPQFLAPESAERTAAALAFFLRIQVMKSQRSWQSTWSNLPGVVKHGRNRLKDHSLADGVLVNGQTQPVVHHPPGIVSLVGEDGERHDGHPVVHRLVQPVLAAVGDEQARVGVSCERESGVADLLLLKSKCSSM